MTLTDTHLVLLSAAAQRQDHLLTRPDKLAGAALQKLMSRLLGAGVVAELKVRHAQPHWRLSEAGDPVALAITPAGLAALGIADEGGASEPNQAKPAAEKPRMRAKTRAGQTGGSAESPVRNATALQPRPGTKQALLVSMLRQDGGATVQAIMTATGWLPHTVRAALTGLRQRGHDIHRCKDGLDITVYRLGGSEPDGTAAPADDAA